MRDVSARSTIHQATATIGTTIPTAAHVPPVIAACRNDSDSGCDTSLTFTDCLASAASPSISAGSASAE